MNLTLANDTQPDLGVESLLGTSDARGTDDLRDTLALSTRYLANWYKATSGSDNKALWYAKIDAVRAKVENTYAELLLKNNAVIPGRVAQADYDDASAAWASLWRELALSLDTVNVSLISEAASFGDTVIEAPSLLVPRIGNVLGNAAGGLIGNILRATWPYLLGAGVLLAVWEFRAPLRVLVGRGVGR